jgi:hypothetical protein
VTSDLPEESYLKLKEHIGKLREFYIENQKHIKPGTDGHTFLKGAIDALTNVGLWPYYNVLDKDKHEGPIRGRR